MNKRKALLLLILILGISAIFAATATAAEQEDFMTNFLKTFGGKFDETYKDYSVIIDMAVYMVIFIGLAYATLGKKYGGTFSTKGGKTALVGIGIVLAVGLALFEKEAGFNIKSFGPLAMGIFIAILCLALYEGLKGFEVENGTALQISYLAAFMSLSAAGVLTWASKSESAIVQFGIMGLGLVALIFAGIIAIKLIGKVMGTIGGGKAKPSGDGAGGGKPGKEPTTPTEAAADEAAAGKEDKLAEEEAALIEAAYNAVKSARERTETVTNFESLAVKDKKTLLKPYIGAMNKATVDTELAMKIARKMENLADKLKERVKKISDEEVSREVEAMEAKAKELSNLDRREWKAMREVVRDVGNGTVTVDALKKVEIAYRKDWVLIEEIMRLDKELKQKIAEKEAEIEAGA